LFSEALQDSMYLASLSCRTGLLYGRPRHSNILCISADSGRTWVAGSPADFDHWEYSHFGAVDELWFQFFNHIMVVLDTGRTHIDPVFIAQPPARPYAWEFNLITTNLAGEAYMLASLDWWGSPYVTEIYVYHIQSYGARVDSFYHRLINFQVADAVSPAPPLPRHWEFAAFPNPFNPMTEIRFSLPEAAKVELRIFNTLGQRVMTLVDDVKPAGTYKVQWDGKTSSGIQASAGTYIYQLKAGKFVDAKKMILLR